VLMGDVRDVCYTMEWKRVMFAECEERNRPFDYLADLAVGAASALSGKDREKLRITLVSDGGVVHCADETAWGFLGG